MAHPTFLPLVIILTQAYIQPISVHWSIPLVGLVRQVAFELPLNIVCGPRLRSRGRVGRLNASWKGLTPCSAIGLVQLLPCLMTTMQSCVLIPRQYLQLHIGSGPVIIPCVQGLHPGFCHDCAVELDFSLCYWITSLTDFVLFWACTMIWRDQLSGYIWLMCLV